MILKTRCGINGENGWLYVDRVRKAQSYGQITGAQAAGSGEEPSGVRLFKSHRELAEYVDEVWGPPQVRDFADELWPDFLTDQTDMRSVTPVRLDLEDKSYVLALLNDEAFLLSESGDTIDRLR